MSRHMSINLIVRTWTEKLYKFSVMSKTDSRSQQISELKLKIKRDYVVGLFIFFKKGNTVTL